MKHVSWSESIIDSPIHFLVQDFGVHIFAWVGPGSDMRSLHVAVPTDGMPPVTTLMSQPGGGDGSAVARRLSASNATCNKIHSMLDPDVMIMPMQAS